MKKDILRIIDVNLNRSCEGLRVCEEITRFVLNDKSLTKGLKNTRYRIHNICNLFPRGWEAFIAARDSESDIGKSGKPLSLTEMKRKNLKDIFFANMQRSKESVRVLEELTKLFDHKLSSRFKRLRFDLYDIEKKVFGKL